MDWEPYRTHSDEIESAIAIVLRRLRLTPADVDDFRQDAKVFIASRSERIFGAFCARCSIRTYLTRILWHYGLDWSRVRSAQSSHLGSRLGTDPIESEMSHDVYLDLDTKEVGERFAEAFRLWFRGLKESDRDLIYLRFVQGQAMSAIAGQRHTTSTAAYKRLYRMLSSFRHHLLCAGIERSDLEQILGWLRCADELRLDSRRFLGRRPS